MIKITLHLTEQEAEAFGAVLNSIGGSPFGPRGLFDMIAKVLGQSFVSSQHEKYISRGELYMVDKWPEDTTTVKVEVT